MTSYPITPAMRRQNIGSNDGFTSSTATLTSRSAIPSPFAAAIRSESRVANVAPPEAPAPAACMRPDVRMPCSLAHALSSTVTLAPVSNRKWSGGPPLTLAVSHTCRARYSNGRRATPGLASHVTASAAALSSGGVNGSPDTSTFASTVSLTVRSRFAGMLATMVSLIMARMRPARFS